MIFKRNVQGIAEDQKIIVIEFGKVKSKKPRRLFCFAVGKNAVGEK